ncbi:MAG: DUF177 domain-containing protein [Elusimicrobiota bacterium]
MKINIEKLKKEKRISGSFVNENIAASTGYNCEKPFEINYEAAIKNDKVKLNLDVKGELNLQCDRCSGSYNHRVSANQSSEISIADFGDEYDVSEEARQLIILSIPMKMLCRDNCKGLCPTCGTNLNEAKCSCTYTQFDYRLEKLREVKFKGGGNK